MYHNINAYAIGGYSNTDFVFDQLINSADIIVDEMSEYIDISYNEVKSILTAIEYAIHFKTIAIIGVSNSAIIVDKIANFLRGEGYDMEHIEPFIQILGDITYFDTNSSYYENLKAICPIFGNPFFMGDLLVDLNSQLGKDNHASGNKQNNYGFKTFSKCFTKDNCDVSKIAMNNMPAVVHNLEPRDDEIIHFILSKINISSNQTSYLYNELDDNTIEIVSYRGNTNISELIIPSEIDGKRVVKIGDYAFANLFNGSSNLTINIPDTTIEIGFFAFANNSSLYKVVFSNSSAIKTINSYSFVNCIKLNRLLYGSASRLPLSLIAIGEKAFYNCNFSSIYINNNLCELGSGAFACNKNLKVIRKTSGNKYFAIDNQYGLYSSDYKTFYMLPMNSSIKDYFINENTLYIDNYACINNKSLDVIHINKNIITIGESAFEALGASNNNQKKKIVYLNCSHVPEAREYSFAKNDIDIYVAYDLKDEYICKWKENADFIKEQKIQISFYANDELKNQLEVNNFSSFIVPSFTEVIDGYMFDGWESDDIEIPWYVGEYYLASYDNKNIIFSTKLTPNVYECEVESINSIEYLSIEKIDEIGNKNYVTYGTTDYKLPVPKIQRRDYRFCGWEDNGIVYTDSEGNGIAIWDKTEKCRLKALLEPIVYNINYELNGGTCNNLIKTYTCESGVIEFPIPFKTSYDFLYWTYMGKEIKKFNVTQYLCDMEITAKWSDYKRIACSTSRTVYDYECIDVSNANSNSSIVLTISPSAYNVIIVGNTNKSYTSFRINISNRYNTNNLYITIENLEIKASIGYDTISYYGTISFDLYLTYKGKCRITGGAGANSRVAGGTGDTGCMAINMHYSNLNFKAADSNSYLYVIGGSGGNGGRGNDGLRGEDGSAASGFFLGNGKDGKDGGNGTNGGTGGTGGYAINSQYIYVYASCNGKIAIFGGDGGNGGAGGNGGRGGDGGAGGGSLVISRNGGDGGKGGNGGNGGDGGAGNTSIYSASYFYNKDYVCFSSGDQGNGGTGGNGGKGGTGGANGPSKFSLGSHGSGGSGGRYGIGGKGYYNGGCGLGGYPGSYYYIDKKL